MITISQKVKDLKNNNINVIIDPKLPKNRKNLKTQKCLLPKSKIRQTLKKSLIIILIKNFKEKYSN